MSQLFIASSQADDPYTNRWARHFSEQPSLPTPTFFFAAATSYVSHLADVLALISAVDRHALMVISPNGITFFSEYNHILNVQATVDASLFSAFEYHWTRLIRAGNMSNTPKNVQLGIDVNRLKDAFSAAAATLTPRGKSGKMMRNSGNPVASAHLDHVLCYMKYRSHGYPLVIEFEDRFMSEQIEFATYHLDIEFPFGDDNDLTLQERHSSALTIDHSTLRFEVILKSVILANLLQDLQNLNTENLYMYVSNDPAAVSLLFFLSKGAIGYLKLIYPNAKSLLQKLEIYPHPESEPLFRTDSVVSTLLFSPFFKVFRAVKFSAKCKIMKDFSGVFLIQFLCRNNSAQKYPGTLVAFNMLERSVLTGTGQAADIDIDSLFDDQVYQHIREYENYREGGELGTRTGQHRDQGSENDPLSFLYATFMQQPNTGGDETTEPSSATGIPFFF